MMSRNGKVGVIFGVMLIGAGGLMSPPLWAQKMGGGGKFADPVEKYFHEYDKNGNGMLDRDEWNRRGNFDLLDTDHNGVIDRKEFAAIYHAFGKGFTPVEPTAVTASVTDASAQTDAKDVEAVQKPGICVITRSGKCPNGDELAMKFGLIQTGLGPVFPPQAICPNIDETYAYPYNTGHGTGKGGHGGIDIPVAFGTPIVAAADGTVVGVVTNERQARGIAITLRHSPEDAGMPMWTFTEYAHLKSVPTLTPGQRVKKGDVIAETGNTGVKPNSPTTISKRRPGIHFAVYFSQSGEYAFTHDYVIPVERPNWMDPVAFFRPKGPYVSDALLNLPDTEKDVAVPVMMVDRSFSSADAKRIWPYACKPAAGK